MKNLLLLLVALVVLSNGAEASYIDKHLKETKKNEYFNSVKTLKRDYDRKEYKFEKNADIKDPGLIKFATYKEIPEENYQAKLKEDEEIYAKKIAPKFYKKKKKNTDNETVANSAGVDYYNIYRICEKIIRANNLDYVNWRIAVRKTKDFNASAYPGYYIMVNTGLYDSLYQNDDALAFVLAHEMAHEIMGHHERRDMIANRLAELKADIKAYSKKSDKEFATSIYNAYALKAMASVRDMEFMADSEALHLLITAGYSPAKAMGALNFMDTLSADIKGLYDTHPITPDRIKSYEEYLSVSDPNWAYVGRENIYNSKVMTCKKSPDRVSIIFPKSQKNKKFYEVETVEQKLARISYIYYLKGDMKNSMKYFKKLLKMNRDNYIPYVYMSFINNYIYEKTGKKRFLRRAYKTIMKAYELKNDSPEVLSQIADLEKLRQK